MKDILLKLKPKTENVDYTKMVIKMANDEDVNFKAYDVSEVSDVIEEFKDEFIKYIIKHGLTSLLNRSVLLEALVKKGTPKNRIVTFFKQHLDGININEELIILDPYFYASTRDPDNYMDLIAEILNKYLSDLKHIIIITNNRIDRGLKQQIETQLKSSNPNLTIDHKVTDEWHDRFWISGSRKKGIITGTSLNGYGCKYALIDKANESDVSDVVNELTASQLI